MGLIIVLSGKQVLKLQGAEECVLSSKETEPFLKSFTSYSWPKEEEVNKRSVGNHWSQSLHRGAEVRGKVICPVIDDIGSKSREAQFHSLGLFK